MHSGVVGFLVLLGGCGGGPQSVEGLTPDEVASVEVFFGNLPDNRPDTGSFQADPEDFDLLLGLRRGGTPDPQPAKWQGLGYLQIRTRFGKEVEAYLYQTRRAGGAYRIGRTYYRGGSDEDFIRVLLECHARAQAKGKA